MNIGIVISIDAYQSSSLNALPACAADGKLIHDILQKTGRFDELLFIKNETQSKAIKRKLSEFIASHKGSEVDTVFFYYTGHGDFLSDDVYFLLPDYAEDKVKQTSLSNTEVDTLLRSLNPGCAVKVVDSCHSGVAYIKNSNALAKSLDDSKARFQRCYFMFSSQKEQFSFQDPSHLSDFTEAFARSIKEHQNSSIRYQDIADFIADAFSNNSSQTPTFVVQADLTEIFCNIDKDMIEVVNQSLSAPAHATATKTTAIVEKPVSLRERVQKDANRYCDKEQAMESLSTIGETASAITLRHELAELYELETAIDDNLASMPNRKAIARWLAENKNEFFVRVDYESQSYTEREAVPKPSHPMFRSLVFGEYEYQKVTKYKQVVSDYSLTITPAQSAVRLSLEPKFQNLLPWQLFVTFVFSKVHIRFFYAHRRLKELSWDDRAPIDNIEWKTAVSPLKEKNSVEGAFNQIVQGFQHTVLDGLKARFEIAEQPTLSPVLLSPDQRNANTASQEKEPVATDQKD